MKETKRRPLLVAALAALALALTAPVAYAVVQSVFLSIDPSQSESEIEDDISEQLEAQGVSDSAVTVEKAGNATIVSIGSVDERLAGKLEVGVEGGEHTTEAESRRLSIHVDDELPPEAMEAVQAAVTSDEFLTLAGGPEEGQSAADYAAELEAFFAERGFEDTEVSVSDAEVSVRIH